MSRMITCRVEVTFLLQPENKPADSTPAYYGIVVYAVAAKSFSRAVATVEDSENWPSSFAEQHDCCIHSVEITFVTLDELANDLGIVVGLEEEKILYRSGVIYHE